MKAGLQHIIRAFALATLLIAVVAGTTVQYAQAAPVKQKVKTEQQDDAGSEQQLRAATLEATVPCAPVLDQHAAVAIVFYAIQHPVIVREHNHADYTPETLSYFRTLFLSSIVTSAP